MVALNNGEVAIIGDSVGAVLWLFFGKNVTEHGPWHDWTREDFYGHYETEGNPRLTNTHNCQTSQRLPRIWKLLSPLYQRLLGFSTTNERTTEEGQEIQINWQMSEVLQNIETMIYRRTVDEHGCTLHYVFCLFVTPSPLFAYWLAVPLSFAHAWDMHTHKIQVLSCPLSFPYYLTLRMHSPHSYLSNAYFHSHIHLL